MVSVPLSGGALSGTIGFSILEKAALFGNFSERKFPCLGLANTLNVTNEHG